MEIATEAAKAAAVELVKPGQEIVADALGGLVGDWLHNWRRNRPQWQERNERETVAAATAVLQEKKIFKAADDARPECVEEIITAAKDTSAPELRALFANLIAAAMDPARAPLYRREFVEIVNRLEPLDARALPLLANSEELAPSRTEYVSNQTGASVMAVKNAFRNLTALELIASSAASPKTQPFLTDLGKQFLACVQ
jgi:hypothetical protein